MRAAPLTGLHCERSLCHLCLLSAQCVQDSRNLPSDLLKYMKSDPEMVNWVGPIGHSNPLLVSRSQYSHIQVGRVEGTEGQEGHNVLLLSTGRRLKHLHISHGHS